MNDKQLDMVLEYLNTGSINEGFFDKFKKKNSKETKNKSASKNNSASNFLGIPLRLTLIQLEEIIPKMTKNSKWDSEIKRTLDKEPDYEFYLAYPSFAEKCNFYVKNNEEIQFSCWDGNQDEGIYCEKIIEKFAKELESNLKRTNKYIKKVYSLSGEDHSDVICIDLVKMSANDQCDYICEKIKEIEKKIITKDLLKNAADKLNKYGVSDTDSEVEYTYKNVPNFTAKPFDSSNAAEIIPDATQDEAMALCYILRMIIEELDELPELISFTFHTGDGDEGCIYW